MYNRFRAFVLVFAFDGVFLPTLNYYEPRETEGQRGSAGEQRRCPETRTRIKREASVDERKNERHGA